MHVPVPEILTWDSDFFGFTVARVFVSGLQDAKELMQKVRELHARVTYIVLTDWNRSTDAILVDAGAELVDRKTTYCKKIPGQFIGKVDCQMNIGELDEGKELPGLVQLAYESGTYSRFLKDSTFGRGSYEKLYGEWLKRSVSREIADKIWIAASGIALAGFVTAKKDDVKKKGQIGLIAVSGDHRGKKVGQALISACESWYMQHGLREARVVTQGSNESACRFYESCRYEVEKVEYYYHLWQ